MLKANNIYNMDCKDIMEEISRGGVELPNGEIKNKVDWCITDPPYAINIQKMSIVKDGAIKTLNAKATRTDYSNTSEWDTQRIDKETTDNIFKISNNQIIFGYNYYADMLPITKSILCWDKRCSNDMRNDFADCEYMWCSQGQARVFRYLWNGMLQGNMANKEKRIHICQKPVALIEMLLSYYTKENDLVLDCFSGSASISIACRKLNRNYIACELDKEYYEASIKRINDEFSQLSFLYE